MKNRPDPDKRPESRATRVARAPLHSPCRAPAQCAHPDQKQIDRAIAAVDLFAGESGTAVSVWAAITPAVATPIFLILIVARFSS